MKFVRVVVSILTLVFGAGCAQLHKGPQEFGVVTGRVTDLDTKEPLARASALIKGTTYGALTDSSGVYVIRRAPAGKCILQVYQIGYLSQEIGNVIVLPNDTTELNVKLQTSADFTQ